MAAELGADVTLPSAPACCTTSARRLTTRWRAPTSSSAWSLPQVQGKEEIIHAIQAHHGDVEPQTLVACLVQAADAISAARPGARRENLENYIKRLEKLEEITGFYGVEAYAIQAGREVRMMVKPEQVSEDQMVISGPRIAKKIEDELDYPGQIKVNVMRETAVEYAK